MAETLQTDDLVWIEGTFKCVNFTDSNGATSQRVKVKVDRAFLVKPKSDSEE